MNNFQLDSQASSYEVQYDRRVKENEILIFQCNSVYAPG
jgi:hypothetical protein